MKEQDVMLVVGPLGPVQELPVMCGLCGTPYQDGESPTCTSEREDAKRVIEERLRERTEETCGLIGDLDEWLEEQGDVP